MKRLNRSIVVFGVLIFAWFFLISRVECLAAEPERVSVEQLKSLIDSRGDMIVVDTRSEISYEDGHIPGAISMPFPDGIRSRHKELPRDKTIILY